MAWIASGQPLNPIAVEEEVSAFQSSFIRFPEFIVREAVDGDIGNLFPFEQRRSLFPSASTVMVDFAASYRIRLVAALRSSSKCSVRIGSGRLSPKLVFRSKHFFGVLA